MSKTIQSTKLEYCTISLREDGLIEQRFLREKEYVITAEDLLEMDQIIKSMCNGQQRCIISIPGLYGSMTPEARKVKVFEETEHTTAIGLIIESLSQRLLAKFYFKINKAPYPVQFFKTELDATTWLHQHNQQHKQVG